MMESIWIKNFGPLKDIKIDSINPFIVFIGESGSGKSTIMKVIALCRWLYKMHNIRSYLKHSKISKSPFRYRMDTYIRNCGFEKYIKNDTEIIYSVKSKSGHSYEIKLTKNKSSLNIIINSDIRAEDICFNKISFITETRNVIPLWADKGASFTGGYLGFYFHEVFGDFDIATESIKDLEMDFLDVKFAVKKSGAQKKYSISSRGNETFEIDLKNSSSGTQNSVPVLLIPKYFSKYFSFEEAFNRSVLSYLSNTDRLTAFKPIKNLGEIDKKIFIHIEEPELSLYPDAQCQLINYLLSTCFVDTKNSIELILSTHSPYIINYLNLLIKRHEQDVNTNEVSVNFENLSVYHVVEGKLENLIVQNERLVNTNLLSETINSIYDQYNALK
jgi:predicted ATP-dependent endonuclease of OLD family